MSHIVNLYSVNLQIVNQYYFYLLSSLLMSCIKGLFVFTVVYFVTQRIKNLPSEYKHILWFFAICSFVLIPVITEFTPAVNLGIFSLSKEKTELFKAFTFLSSTKFTDLDTAGLFTVPGSDLSQRILQTPRFRLYLPSLLLLLWITGIFISSLNIIVGRIILSHLLKRAQSIKAKNFTRMVKQLSGGMGIKQKIRLLKSPQCKLPFTCRIFRPVIVLPYDIEGWPINRTRVVLIHELAHIKRRDYLTKFVSRIICSMYWFMPLIWMAYSKFDLEQEKTCDSFVVNTGARANEYAGQIVDFARIKRKHAMLAGIFISKGRKKMMEKRILNVLRIKGPGSLIKLKRVWLIPSICIFFLSFFLAFNPAVSGNYEKLYGIWANEEYNETWLWPSSKRIFNPDGTFAVYKNTYGTKPQYFGKFVIADSWTDSEGDIWILQDEYQGTYFAGKCVSHYLLIKISNSGDTLEYIVSTPRGGKYPEEIELVPNNANYCILYRQ